MEIIGSTTTPHHHQPIAIVDNNQGKFGTARRGLLWSAATSTAAHVFYPDTPVRVADWLPIHPTTPSTSTTVGVSPPVAVCFLLRKGQL